MIIIILIIMIIMMIIIIIIKGSGGSGLRRHPRHRAGLTRWSDKSIVII